MYLLLQTNGYYILIVSDKNKLIFIHNPKAAGTSIYWALYNKDHAIRKEGNGHSLAREHDFRFYASYFKFGYVRNPWDRMVSYYHMMKENPTSNAGHALWDYFRKINPDNFEEFLDKCVDDTFVGNSLMNFATNQIDYFVDKNGVLLVDYIGKVEEHLVDNPLGLDIPLTNASSIKKDYRSFYTDYTRKLIAERFKRDIEYFGYTYDQFGI